MKPIVIIAIVIIVILLLVLTYIGISYSSQNNQPTPQYNQPQNNQPTPQPQYNQPQNNQPTPQNNQPQYNQPTPQPTPIYGSLSTPTNPKYSLQNVVDAWDSGTNPLQCPNSSIVDGWCIVPERQARSVCNSTPGCTGYVQTTGWFQGSDPDAYYAQLLNDTPVSYGGVPYNKTSEYYAKTNQQDTFTYPSLDLGYKSWAADSPPIQCPGKSMVDGWCITDASVAADVCRSTQGCTGYTQTTGWFSGSDPKKYYAQMGGSRFMVDSSGFPRDVNNPIRRYNI